MRWLSANQEEGFFRTQMLPLCADIITGVDQCTVSVYTGLPWMLPSRSQVSVLRYSLKPQLSMLQGLCDFGVSPKVVVEFRKLVVTCAK